MSARREGDLLLCEHFNLVAYHVDAAVVGGVQLEDRLFEGVACSQLEL